MKKGLLLLEDSDTKKPVEEKVREYCKENDIKLTDYLALSAEQMVRQKHQIVRKIKRSGTDIVFAEGPFMMLSEITVGRSLVNYLEEEGIGCWNIECDEPMRDYVDKLKKTVVQEIEFSKNKKVPVVILYKGDPDINTDKDIQDMVRYIKDYLNEETFAVIDYKEEIDEMGSDLIELLAKTEPRYIIQKEPFADPKLNHLMNEIRRNSEQLNVEVMEWEEIRQELYQEENNDMVSKQFLH